VAYTTNDNRSPSLGGVEKMTWSTKFISELYKPEITPVFKLEFVDVDNGIGRDFVVFSHGKNNLKIGAGGVQVNGVSVVPSRWSVSFGGFTVSLVGDASQLLQAIARGSYANLYCELGSSGFERIAAGQLYGIRRNGVEARLTLQFVDLLTAFQNRTSSVVGAVPTPSTANPPRQDLFFELGTFRSVVGNWSPGDTSLTLTNTTGIRRETSENGLIKCFPTSSDNPFYLEFASSTSTTVATTPNSGQEAFPSEYNAAQLHSGQGSFVVLCAQIDDHPTQILGKIIESTGTGNNGSLDTLPVEWSIGGVFGVGLWDQLDANLQQTYITGSTTTNYKWRFVVEAPLENGIRDILNTASNVGQWMVFRQGQLSWRGCQDPNVASFVAGQLGDRDIFQVVSHDLFDPVQQQIFPISTLEYSSTVPLNSLERNSVGVTSGRLGSFPATRQVKRTAIALYSPDTNEADLALGDLDRMANWDHFTFERVTLRCKLITSQFVAGDILEITSDRIIGLKGTYQNQRVMVLASSFDFSSNSSIITVAAITGDR
jgi:hypothetical protein